MPICRIEGCSNIALYGWEHNNASMCKSHFVQCQKSHRKRICVQKGCQKMAFYGPHNINTVQHCIDHVQSEDVNKVFIVCVICSNMVPAYSIHDDRCTSCFKLMRVIIMPDTKSSPPDSSPFMLADTEIPEFDYEH